MSWLVVGASGQLGMALEKVLTQKRLTVISAGSKELDITHAEAVNTFIQRHNPRVIVNAAAWTDVDSAEENFEAAYAVNALGARNLALASKNVGSTFVQVSTDYVFSGQSLTPWKVSNERDPVSAYGRSKSAGENFVSEVYPENSYIVRTAWLYSATRKNFAKTMVRLALLGDNQVRVVNDQIGQPTFVGDLADQIINMVTTEIAFGCYHGTNTGQASWFEFTQEIFRLAGADVSRVIPVSSSEYPRPAKRPAYSVLNHDDWKLNGLESMRNWKISLAEAMPAIITAVKLEG
jgi:dTDP-4-dehydrorhamnose reductase